MQEESVKKCSRDYVCAQCGSEIVAATGEQPGQYVAICGHDKSHKGMKRIESATTALARGELDEVAQPGTQREMEAVAKRMPERFTLLPKADVETGAMLTPDDITALDAFAQSIGLNIYLGHVELYYGKPRVSIDGYYYLARAQGRDISIASLPAIADDYERYKVDKADFFSIARGWIGGQEVHETGIGIVTQAELSEMSRRDPSKKRSPVVARYPQRMAEKRAEWQLLRKSIPLEVKE